MAGGPCFERRATGVEPGQDVVRANRVGGVKKTERQPS